MIELIKQQLIKNMSDEEKLNRCRELIQFLCLKIFDPGDRICAEGLWPGRWRKLKGTATVRLFDGTVCKAELHWYEAHGIGKKEMKIKHIFLK